MRVAVLQFAPALGIVAPNLDVIRQAAGAAKSAGASLLVAPEMSLTGWTLREEGARRQLARDVEEQALPQLERDAIAHRIAIVVGGPVVADQGRRSPEGDDPLANAAILLAPDGSWTVYRKIHLFGEERAWWTPGRAPAVAIAESVRIGLTICFDAEFPEVPRMTRLAGADVIAVPATNMTPYEHDQDIVFATRALENECPVIVANRVGREGDWTYFGRSLVADQRGRIVAQAGSGEDLLFADIAPGEPGDSALSYLAQRRPETYGLLVETTQTVAMTPSSRA